MYVIYIYTTGSVSWRTLITHPLLCPSHPFPDQCVHHLLTHLFSYPSSLSDLSLGFQSCLPSSLISREPLRNLQFKSGEIFLIKILYCGFTGTVLAPVPWSLHRLRSSLTSSPWSPCCHEAVSLLGAWFLLTPLPQLPTSPCSFSPPPLG